MKKLTFDEAIDRVNDDRNVNASGVLASALRRKVWVAEWHLPGCLSESYSVCLSKADAIGQCLLFAESEDGAPRGMKTALVKHGRFDSQSEMYGTCINTVTQRTLSDIL